ncbi:MAG TPA: MaoC/PaaZ C-terminal domain-containing protein [Actinomycetota bacterium]|jgi:acyl dehydratase
MTLAFEDVSVGQEVPTLARLVTREDVKDYADASGDQNPLHQDEAVARAAGFPGVVAHGMYTMGTLASAIVRWTGDASSLVRMRVQFRAPVIVGETIECGGSVRSLDPHTRTAVLDVWVRVRRGEATEWPIRKSEAEVRLP